MYKEHLAQSEDTPLRIHYTDRQGVPMAIDITGKELNIKKVNFLLQTNNKSET
jgi:hypothetical protein